MTSLYNLNCPYLSAVGEPINTEAWEWYHSVVGDGRCPVVDTWWQTGNWKHSDVRNLSATGDIFFNGHQNAI